MHSSKQERSRRTAERLLDAAERLAGEVGFERLTLAQVARGAECTTGAVYGRFGSKAALLEALHVRHIQRGQARFSAKLVDLEHVGSKREKLHSLVELFVDEYEEHWPIIDAFAAVLSTHLTFAQRNAELVETLATASSSILSVKREDAVLCVALVMGTLDRTMRLREVAPHLELPDHDVLVAQLAGACAGVMGLKG